MQDIKTKLKKTVKLILKKVTIRHDALRDIWPEQVNTINVEGKGKLQTLTFTDSVELLTLTFKQ